MIWRIAHRLSRYIGIIFVESLFVFFLWFSSATQPTEILHLYDTHSLKNERKENVKKDIIVIVVEIFHSRVNLLVENECLGITAQEKYW